MYTEQERLIFRYNDGKKNISADPLVIFRKLMDCSSFQEDAKVLAMGHDKSHIALGSVVKGVREIFNLFPLDQETEEGLTDSESLQVLVTYGLFMETLKKKINFTPILQTLTEDSPQTPA